jgi:glutaminyl-peptide cyclotransferase
VFLAQLSTLPISFDPQLLKVMKIHITQIVFVSMVLAACIGIAIFAFSQINNTPESNVFAQNYSYSIVQVYPHDTSAFTEGLVFVNGSLYESTGLYGDSTLRQVDLLSGEVLQKIFLDDSYFGEGMTVVDDKIVQLTWQEHIAFIYDRASFKLIGNFTYSTEGWGLTFDGTKLIMSDGSNTLSFIDPSTFQKTGQVQVRDGNTSVSNLNELEYVNGDVYANVFLEQKIAVINPQTGQVKAWINLSGIQDLTSFHSEMVLNGIAYDAHNKRLFVTGKDWPHLFEIKLVPQK